MKITFIAHASILIETRGLRILSDPWWSGPCFGAQWWVYPKAHTAPLGEAPINYIYISHGHHDHLHPGTLKTLNKDAKVLVARDLDLAEGIRRLGFEVIELSPDQVFDMGKGVSCRIQPTEGDDTLMMLDDGEQVVGNLNDAVHPLSEPSQDRFMAWIAERYPKVDYLFVGYGTASHFPNCYRVPGKDDAATAIQRQGYFNRTWARIVGAMKPRFAFPFAASLAFFEDDLFAYNAPVHNPDRPTLRFEQAHPGSATRAIDWNHGFVIEDGEIIEDIRHQDFDEALCRRERAGDITRANTYGRVTDEHLDELERLLRENLDTCAAWLREYSGDWHFVIALRNCDQGFALYKKGTGLELERLVECAMDDVAYDVRLIARVPYLKRSLTEPYGNEILFVGSGCVIDYPSRAKADTNVHRELFMLLGHHPKPPRSRFGDQSKLAYTVKTGARKVLGKTPRDFYDLADWIVYR
ncbi:MAG: MBL fold metallo-hydrolase [Gammaproteobacteria bacterium]